MRNLKLILVSILILSASNSFANEKIPAYYKIGVVKESIPEAANIVKNALSQKGFETIGEYHPGNNKNLYVIAFSSKQLQSIVLKKKDRGLMASVIKVGFYLEKGNLEISLLNPMYIFHAYLMEEIKPIENELKIIDKDIKDALKRINPNFVEFGGDSEIEDLWEYQYMFGMPYFTDPIELREFNSFEEGLKTIRANLDKKPENTAKVYEIVIPEKKVAVFGIAMLDTEIGESKYLPTIGEKHTAAMPYELILQDNEASMLNGRYRIALHWPLLSMSTFMQIVNTPGNIEDTFEKIVE
ncbi:MAG: hypothetical protein HN704_08730 [Bacteroidetes bacterium]|nr:hypothetical protein [Bacteroidota bacterium]MBT6687498.1 hypothetical protein [Bacteroidota bacterium]MBT7142986.1 hypothetical protein [Bacteroidota bacterium]MBT7491676.1 hypothetical protein [Bacteroidota bacterium]